MQRQFYVVDINGKNKKALRSEEGWHSINMGGDFKYYIDSHSSPTQPLKETLYENKKNTVVKVLEDNAQFASTIQA